MDTGYSIDQVFINKVTDILEINLGNEQFGVRELARELGMSRSNLHRKLHGIKGKSTSQFIREYRLERAIELLQNNVASISEIAYRVGFHSDSYFNTCFHNFFGHTPGEVKKGNHRINHEPYKSKIETQYINRANPDKIINPSRGIAILPLDHLSQNSELEYLTAGIHDALIGELGSIDGLRVISRTSTLKYPGRLSMQQIAQELGVDVIVEGSVLINGNNLRLQLQLIDVFPEEQHIWAQEYYLNVSSILSMQNNAIQDIAKTINIKLTAEDKNNLTTIRKVKPVTYKASLREIYYSNKSTKRGISKEHELFE